MGEAPDPIIAAKRKAKKFNAILATVAESMVISGLSPLIYKSYHPACLSATYPNCPRF